MSGVVRRWKGLVVECRVIRYTLRLHHESLSRNKKYVRTANWLANGGNFWMTASCAGKSSVDGLVGFTPCDVITSVSGS